MINKVAEKISVLKDELAYQVKLWQHQGNLPVLTGNDAIAVIARMQYSLGRRPCAPTGFTIS
ncbi:MULTISPECIES: hypothetical protein [Nostocales]|uniref:hypothetical protein n=1 Tax=Nostocales TaxID=1161 RepID=UPI000542DD2D|nr:MULTISPECIES: hypothetical protein [Nostocales]ALB43095.1 hypothetical protein AA650_23915 [Anabaena sp. WA102]KHG39636.1 hypothetical protein OA07_22250 [Aphanizomenon flos-aquae 2012/KM1/D3]OBQ16118.1 MAG: hypothetical protein AN486_20350 [Anabaena sp. AL93]